MTETINIIPARLKRREFPHASFILNPPAQANYREQTDCNRRQKAEGRRQKAEGRRQKAEGRVATGIKLF